MKRLISLLIVLVMTFSFSPAFALNLDNAYSDFKTAHPEFVDSLISHGIPDEKIFCFVSDVYDYLMEIDASTPVTTANFEENAITAINRVSARTEYHSLQDALIILYPDAIRLALTEGKVAPDFQPLVDTIKKILFDGKDSFTSEDAEVPQQSLFSDIDKNHWAYISIDALAKNMILNGYLDGTFKPENNITRAEFAKIIVSATDTFDYLSTSAFRDVSTDDWYYSYVSSAYKLGYITGYPDGSFHPDDKISRADICTIVNRVLNASPTGNIKFTDDSKIPEYAKNAVYALASKKIINGFSDGSFAPTAFATRAQTAKIIYSAFFNNR